VINVFLECLKLVELTIIMVLGNVEEERTFSIFNFMKLKFHNWFSFHSIEENLSMDRVSTP
jgi:hypothetical protein